MNKKIIIFILIIISLFSSWRLLRSGYPSMQDDIQIFRLQQFDQCLKDAQIPCRYISDGGLGYGYPLYNFYSPLPYAIAEFFHLLGFSFINSIKTVFIIPAFLRSFGMYFFSSAFFGPLGGLLAATLYSLAPYQALNTFVRGALGEAWALSLIPLVFWSLYKHKTKLSILFFSFLFLSHNLSLIYILPLLTIFSLITKKFKYFLRTIVWSGALCAFYLLPAFFEKNLTTVSTMTQGFFYYIIHFATLKQIFLSNFWGYAGTMWGPIDGLSFNIGLFQFILPIIVFIYALTFKKTKDRFLLIIFFLIGLFALFLTHNKSTFLWQLFSFMAYFQFPWRFLGLALFCFSFVAGGLLNLLKINLKLPLILLLVTSITFLNIPYFREDIWYPNLTDREKLSRSELIRQSAAGLMDYWPKYGQEFPSSYAPSTPVVIEGDVDFIKFYKNSHYSQAYFSVLTPTATVNLPIVYFPKWELILDGNNTDYKIDPNLSLIQLELKEGEHNYELKFKNTSLRTFANLLSLLSLGSFIILIIREKKS